MADKNFADALNEQISNEFAASQQYVGAAVYYDAETLPRLAAFFYRQAVEERNHAMIMVQYLLDTDEEVQIPDIKSQQTRYDDVGGPVKMALEQEKRVSDEINDLFKLAREHGDFPAEQFLTWFVKEQVEEVSSMTDLLNVCRAGQGQPAADRGLPGSRADRRRGRRSRDAPGCRRRALVSGPVACGAPTPCRLAWRASGAARVCPRACR